MKKQLLVVLFIIAFLCQLMMVEGNLSDTWSDSNYQYRKLYVCNFSNPADQDTAAINFTIHYGYGADNATNVFMNQLCRTDFADLRFYNTYGVEFNAFADSKNDSSAAHVWIYVTNIIDQALTTTFYIYYGYLGAESNWVSNFNSTIVLYNATAYRDAGWGFHYLNRCGYWALNESSGTNVLDSSGYGFTGTASAASWTTGKFGGAYQFLSASNHKITVVNNNCNDLNNSLTVSLWLKFTANPAAAQAIISNYDGSNHGYFMYIATNGAIDGAYAGTHTVSSPLTTNIWHHVVLTYDGVNNIRLYVDNVSVSNATHAPTTQSGKDLLFGYSYGGYAGGYLNATVDELRLYNRTLNTAEINALYTYTPTELTTLYNLNQIVPYTVGGQETYVDYVPPTSTNNAILYTAFLVFMMCLNIALQMLSKGYLVSSLVGVLTIAIVAVAVSSATISSQILFSPYLQILTLLTAIIGMIGNLRVTRKKQ